MATLIRRGETSNILRLVLPTDEATNLTEGLKIAVICDNESTPVIYTEDTILSIGVVGQFELMPSGHCRFKKVSSDIPFLYELHLPNSRFSVSEAASMIINISFGPARVQNVHYEIKLDVHDKIYEKFTEDFNYMIFRANEFVLRNLLQDILDKLTGDENIEYKTVTVFDESLNPVEYVKTWLTADLEGRQRVSEVVYSNSAGDVSFYKKREEILYLWRYHPSVPFSNPIIF